MKTLQKEIVIFFITFLLLAIGMHFDAWIHYPIKQINNLESSSLGLWHPIVITLIVYLFIGLGRGLLFMWKKIKKNKKKGQ